MTKYARILMAAAMLLMLASGPALAGTTATASVQAVIPSILTLALIRDANSVTRGTTNQIIFNKLDSVDTTGGDPGLMYAPYRTTEAGKNWHVAQIAANGLTMKLRVTVSGNIGTTPLANILKIYCGGFFYSGSDTEITGTKSTDWDFADGWERSLSQPFTGTAPFFYQLNVSTIGSGTFNAAGVTFTLSTT